MSSVGRIRSESSASAVRLMAPKTQANSGCCLGVEAVSLREAYSRLVDSMNDTKRLLEALPRRSVSTLAVEVDEQIEQKDASDS